MMPTSIPIAVNHVYSNVDGEQRLVVEVSRSSSRLYGSTRSSRPQPVVSWRTADPKLPAGAKAQGGATLRSFQRWAVSCRKATPADWAAFEALQNLRYWRTVDRAMVRQIRKKQGLGHEVHR